jgi:hypothetical protein
MDEFWPEESIIQAINVVSARVDWLCVVDYSTQRLVRTYLVYAHVACTVVPFFYVPRTLFINSVHSVRVLASVHGSSQFHERNVSHSPWWWPCRLCLSPHLSSEIRRGLIAFSMPFVCWILRIVLRFLFSKIHTVRFSSLPTDWWRDRLLSHKGGDIAHNVSHHVCASKSHSSCVPLVTVVVSSCSPPLFAPISATDSLSLPVPPPGTLVTDIRDSISHYCDTVDVVCFAPFALLITSLCPPTFVSPFCVTHCCTIPFPPPPH